MLAEAQAQLQRQLRPKYVARLERQKLSQQPPHHTPMYIRKPVIAALEAVDEFFVVES